MTGRYNAQPIETRDDEWTKQFNNLSNMLDHYLVSANASIPSTRQDATQPSYNQQTNAQSDRTTQGNLNPNLVLGLRAHNQFYANNTRPLTPNTYNPNAFTINSNVENYPQELGGLPRPQNQPENPSGKKLSPRRLPQKQQPRRQKSGSSRNSPRAGSARSNERSVILDTSANQSFAQFFPHLDYDPRVRARYGQANISSRSLEGDMISQFRTPRSDTSQNFPSGGYSQQQLQQQNRQPAPITVQSSELDNLSSRYYPQSAKNYPNQQNFWATTGNPYSKQTGSQSQRNPYAPGTDQSNGFSEPFVQKNQEALISNGFRLNIPSPGNPKRALSPSADNQNSGRFISPRPLSPRLDVDYSVAPRQLGVQNIGNANAFPRQNLPRALNSSTNQMVMLKKQSSTDNLVEENLQKLERSVILQKKGEDQVMGIEQEHSLMLSVQDIEAKAKEIVGSVQRNKRSPLYSPLGISYIERGSPESDQKSPRTNPLAYEVVIEHYADGSKYEGEKQSGKRHGRGVFYYKEGFKYDGDWEDGFMKGYGILWQSEKTKVYEGEWMQNVFHGRGTVYNHEITLKQDFDGTDFRSLQGGWTKFEGLFYLGAKQGLGTLFLANGDIHVGRFTRDVVHGRGSYTAKSGKTFVGMWQENVLVDKF